VSETKITSCHVSAYTIPTDYPESDGTLEWNNTTLVLVTLFAGGEKGIGFTYAPAATAMLIRDMLLHEITGQDCMDIPTLWLKMVRCIRNAGRAGICSMAIAAVDNALWDLKAKVLKLPLVMLLGKVREGVPVYGSGGFISYSVEKLQQQFYGWVGQGIKMVKMKIGRDVNEDKRRIAAAREAISAEAELFIDANGGYAVREVLDIAEFAADYGVTWFEEPVSSDNLQGLAFIRKHAPAGMAITAGEYGYNITYFKNMLDAEAVDVLQLDATRCAGITGFMEAAALSKGFHIPNSAHTAPSIHIAPCCALSNVRHIEYFYDHVRIEKMLFEGTIIPKDGMLYPNVERPGMGLEFKEKDAEQYKVF
jgi:L-alanine-DL-glutamate epimerase-like enolase superfamily enzyme